MSKTSTKKTKQATSIKPLRAANCPTLSGKSTLTYDLGTDSSKSLHFRISANDGGGFFSSEWIAWKHIDTAIRKTEPVTSICLRPLFKGKSVNTSGFLLAVLVAEGLLVALPKKSRHFEVTGKKPVATKSTSRKAPNKKARK